MIRINIAFRAGKEVENEAIKIATSLAKNKEHFSFLDAVTSLPHISLYAPVVEENTIVNVMDNLEKVLSHIEPLYLTMKEITENNGYVGIEFGLTPDIKAIQEKIISATESFRTIDVSEKYKDGRDYHMELSPGGLQSLEKYGSVGVINFHPHMTLFRLKNDIDAQMAKRKVVWSIPRFLVTKIGVFIMGESGVCSELIGEIPFRTETT